jgi:shikimate dehydrogenase
MDSDKKIAAIIGWPVAHSLSPKLHNYWLKHYGINGEYTALTIRPEDLAATIKSFAAKGFVGGNVTVPHKETAVPLLDAIDEEASAIGAVNTLVIQGGKIFGRNTDAYGFIENIRPHLQGRKNKAVVLGAGGASRAVIHALGKIGFAEIVITNRTQEKAEALAARFGTAAEAWEKRSALLEGADLLVNTTSLGLEGHEPLEIDLAQLPKSALVTDIVYRPLMTPLLGQAGAHGNIIVDGLGMLIHQAVPGFKAWFGVAPPVTEEIRQFLLGG